MAKAIESSLAGLEGRVADSVSNKLLAERCQLTKNGDECVQIATPPCPTPETTDAGDCDDLPPLVIATGIMGGAWLHWWRDLREKPKVPASGQTPQTKVSPWNKECECLRTASIHSRMVFRAAAREGSPRSVGCGLVLQPS